MTDLTVKLLNSVFGGPIHEGKVRYSYLVNPVYCNGRRLRAVYVSDQISSDDFVWSDLILGKGEILNAMSTGMKVRLRRFGIKTDLVAWGKDIDRYLDPGLRGNPELYKRLVIVEELEMLKGELLPRALLLGTAAAQYADPNNPDHIVYGVKLAAGLQQGDRLPEPLFTVSTKAAIGHDVPQDSVEFLERYPGSDRFTMDVFTYINEVSETEGRSFFGDSKFEVGVRPEKPAEYILADEVATGDSSRIIPIGRYRDRLRGKPLIGDDKEYFRIETRKLYGVNKLDPKIPEHVAQVGAIKLPQDLIGKTREIYSRGPKLVFGLSLEQLQWQLGMVA